MDSLRDFIAIQIVSFGSYDVSIRDLFIIVPVIFAAFLIFRIYRRFNKKRGFEGRFVKNLMRIFRWILVVIVFLTIMRVLGVRLSNAFDFIKAVINFKLFTMSGTDVSLLTLIILGVVVWIATKLARLARNYFNKTVFPRFNLDEGVRFSLSKLIGYSIILIGIFIALQGMGIKLSALTVFAGVLGVGIGFGMQSITANFVSGFAILFERPIKEGDMVRLKDTVGEIKKINLRATVVRTIYNEHLIVPNSEFMNSVVENMSYGDLKLRISVRVGVAYGTDPFFVRDVLIAAALETEHVMKNPEPNVLFKEFGDSSLNFELFAWIDRPEKRFKTESDLHFNITSQFKKNNITIPFPQHDVYIKQMPVSDPPKEV